MLAFDYGEKRIGVAVGDTQIKIAHPIDTILVKGEKDLVSRIQELLKEWQPDILIVGWPVKYDGEEHALAKKINNFCKLLHNISNLKVKLVDERYRSFEAEQKLKSVDIGGVRAKQYLDELSAAAILEVFFTGISEPVSKEMVHKY